MLHVNIKTHSSFNEYQYQVQFATLKCPPSEWILGTLAEHAIERPVLSHDRHDKLLDQAGHIEPRPSKNLYA
jgi:hypothetical protein